MTLKTDAPFWGGVEVACSYTSLGHAILPKAVRFRGIIIILCIGNNDTALVPFV